VDRILAGTADSPAIADISDGRESGRNKLTLGPGVWLTGAAFVAVEMAVSARYGFYSDELYFLAAGRHLAFGYVDQPPLAPLLTRVSTIVFGDSLSALRVIPAIAGGALVVIAGLIARLLGGGRAASLLTALAVGCAPVTLMVAHFATTTIYDLLSWSAVLALTLAAVLRHRPKLWLAVGAVTGVALENNNLILLLVAALLCGLVLTRRWEVLRTPWLLAGAAVALALWAPYLAWQATHGWPQLTVARALQVLHSSAHDYITVVPAEFAYLGLAALPLAVIGAIRLVRDRSLRFLGIAAGLVFAYVVVEVPGRRYYPDGLLPLIFAAGAVTIESHVSSRRTLRAWMLAPPIGAALTVALFLPILPVSAIHQLPLLHRLNSDSGETIGWPQLTAEVARVFNGLPAGQRAQTSIFTNGYAEAAAISWYGPAQQLPTPLSGSNNYWLWGPGRAPDGTVVAVGTGAELRQYFDSCTLAATFRTPYDINNAENGVTISICTGPHASWPQLWPLVRNYGWESLAQEHQEQGKRTHGIIPAP